MVAVGDDEHFLRLGCFCIGDVAEKSALRLFAYNKEDGAGRDFVDIVQQRIVDKRQIAGGCESASRVWMVTALCGVKFVKFSPYALHFVGNVLRRFFGKRGDIFGITVFRVFPTLQRKPFFGCGELLGCLPRARSVTHVVHTCRYNRLNARVHSGRRERKAAAAAYSERADFVSVRIGQKPQKVHSAEKFSLNISGEDTRRGSPALSPI